MKQYLIGMFISLVLVLVIASLFLTSFMAGVMDGCRDAGYDEFAIGRDGVYCIRSNGFAPLYEPVRNGEL